MNWVFELDDIEIEEPLGFNDLELSIVRDDKGHGISFEASTSPIEFYGAGYAYLKNKKETEGVKANVTFRASANCEGYDYSEVLSGRLNFGKAKEKCGDVCTISIPWEEDSCEVVLKSRYDQKVDIEKQTGVDNITALPDYLALGQEKELNAHDIRVATEGNVSEEGDTIDLSIFAALSTVDFSLRPTYSRQLYANIKESQLIPTVFASSSNGINDSAISPAVLLTEEIDCFNGDFEYEVRLKGSYDIYFIGVGASIENVTLNIAKGTYPTPLTILHQQVLPFSANSAIGTFDYTFTGSTALNQDEGYYAWFGFEGEGNFFPILAGSVTFDPETYIDIEAVRSCPPTKAELFMVHETLSRAVEAVTNGCVRVKSSYYGRTDSQPFSFNEDGCGGLRSLTSGLKIRRAVDGKFFASPKDIIEGLNAIDNIGMGVELDPNVPGKHLLVIEDLDYFYREEEILRHDAIPKADTDTEETRHYSKIDVGYKNWEVENVNGLDEIHSTRQYNTSLDTINSSLDITSQLVAGSYPIEITRQQSFAITGAADTKFDNNIFILSMVRTGYLYATTEVDKGNISNAENIFSPGTIFNYPLSPVRNLMRWYKSIAAGYANISDSENQLFFLSGTGNIQAKGMQTDGFCRIESMPIQENQNLYVTHFANANDYRPKWKNELMTYEYPLSIAEYNAIKNNPYGYISAQCGQGEFLLYWIKEIKFKIAKGSATFVLRRKY